MIKKTIIFISLTAVALGSYAVCLPAFASEISGTLSTDEGQTSVHAGESSEIAGVITTTQGILASNNNYTYYYNNPTSVTPANPVIVGTVVGGVDEDMAPTNDTATYTMDISEFGPRSGSQTSSAAPASSGSILLARSGTGSTQAETLADSTILPPFAGGVFGDSNSSDLGASAINTPLGRAGMSAAQLFYIAFIGVLLIASMGYAISSTSRRLM